LSDALNNTDAGISAVSAAADPVRHANAKTRSMWSFGIYWLKSLMRSEVWGVKSRTFPTP